MVKGFARRSTPVFLVTLLVSSCFFSERELQPLPDVLNGCYAIDRGNLFEIKDEELRLPKPGKVADVLGIESIKNRNYVQFSQEILLSGLYLHPGRSIHARLEYRIKEGDVMIAVPDPKRGTVWFRKVDDQVCTTSFAQDDYPF